MSKFIHYCILAAVCLLAPILPHAAFAQSGEMSAEEVAEYNAITNDLIMPAVDDMSKVVGLLQNDPAQACTLVKSTHDKTTEAGRRTRALSAKLKAEGKDTSSVDAVTVKLDNLVAQADKIAPSVCGGQAASNDPETQAFLDKLSGYLTAFVTAAKEASAARQAGDTPLFCQRSRDALKVLDDLDVLAEQGRQMMRAKGQSEAQFDTFAQQTREARAAITGSMTECPAA